MEIPTTVVPMSPGIFSALGLLVTDLKHDYATTLIQRVAALDAGRVDEAFQRMEREGQAALAREGIDRNEVQFARQVEMRYVGQSYELALSLPNRALSATDLDALLEQFHRAHERAYGFSAPAEPTEFVNLRLTAMGKIYQPQLHELQNKDPDTAGADKGTRQVYFAESGGYVDCAIYDRYKLGAGGVIAGPAIVEEFDSTTVLHPGYAATVDRYGNLFVKTKDV
jgi:N-methylhydantoinase A